MVTEALILTLKNVFFLKAAPCSFLPNWVRTNLLLKLLDIFYNFFIPPINRSGYGSADLFNDFTDDFLVFYLRGLQGFDSDCHFVTSFKNITVFGDKVKRRHGD